MPLAAESTNTLTICLAGIASQNDLELAIKAFHADNPSFTTSRLECTPHRHTGSFVVSTSYEVTSFLDAVSDFFHRDHATPIVWPAPRGDKLSPAAPAFVYPHTAS